VNPSPYKNLGRIPHEERLKPYLELEVTNSDLSGEKFDLAYNNVLKELSSARPRNGTGESEGVAGSCPKKD